MRPISTALRPRTARALTTAFLLAAALATCAAPAHAQEVRLSETFDAPAPPDLPEGWTGDWVTSTSSASSGSGEGNLADTGTGVATALSPAFSLSGAGAATITYLARRTSSYPADALALVLETSAGAVPVPGSGLPEASSAWTSLSFDVPAAALGYDSVRLRFDSAGGTSSGSNARIDDLAVTVTGPAATGGTLGFAADTTVVLGGTTGALVPLDLHWSGTGELHGLQFTLDAGVDSAALTGYLRGPALSDLSAWTLSNEGGNTLALSNSSSGLGAGDYLPLLSAVFDATDVADTVDVTLGLTGLIGSYAVPEGDDAGLVASPASAVLRIVPRAAVFDAVDSLDLGVAPVGGSADAPLWIYNRGTADLVVADLATDHTAFSVSPESLTVPPGDSAEVTVTFAPGVSDVGYLTARVLTDATPRTVLTGTATAAWGDATGDGLVDVSDIVLGVDVALGRTAPGAEAEAGLDVYPFPEGDGAVDVRDLTVITLAVLSGSWPGGVPLPGFLPEAVAGKSAEGVRFFTAGEILMVQIAQPVRAIQAEFLFDGGATRLGEARVSLTGTGRLRVLWVPLYGTELPLGDHPIATLTDGLEPRLLGGLAIDPGRERLTIPPSEIPVSEVKAPYPNPFVPGRDVHLVLPLAGEVRVVDVLGREIWRGVGKWDGLTRTGNPAAAGWYSVIARAGAWPVVLLRQD